MILIKPNLEYIPSFIEALKEGPFTHMALGNFGDATWQEVENDPEAYLNKLNDTSPRQVETANGETFTFADHFILWAVNPNNKKFLAGISFRFDDNDLINTYCGHVGMSVRPALLNRGYGARAAINMVELVMNEARKRGMKKLSASANPTNPASYKIIEYMGGKLILERDPYGWGVTRFYELEINQ